MKIKTKNEKLEEEKDLLLLLVATLKKQPRKKINALNLLANKILSANAEQLKTLKKKVNILFESESQNL